MPFIQNSEIKETLKSIDSSLGKISNPQPEPPAPPCARHFYDCIKSFTDGVNTAEEVRQDALNRAEKYRGSSAYQPEIDAADGRFHDSMRALGEKTKAAIRSIADEMENEYKKNISGPIPADKMQAAQIFSMITRPTAETYTQYEAIFEDYPQLMEVLTSKYNADLHPASGQGYLPKFHRSGSPYTPPKVLTGNDVEEYLSYMLKNSFSFIDDCADLTKKFAPIYAAQRRMVETTSSVPEALSAFGPGGADYAKEILGQIDKSYRPSLSRETVAQSAENEYSQERNYRDTIEAAENPVSVQRAALDYCIK